MLELKYLIFLSVLGVSSGIIYQLKAFSQAVLEWDGWVMPSKISYGVFLVHMTIIDYLFGLRNHLVPVCTTQMAFMFVGVLVFSYMFALILYLLVEAPAQELRKLVVESAFTHTINVRNKKRPLKYQ